MARKSLFWVKDAYAALQANGVPLPEQRNLANLAGVIGSSMPLPTFAGLKTAMGAGTLDEPYPVGTTIITAVPDTARTAARTPLFFTVVNYQDVTLADGSTKKAAILMLMSALHAVDNSPGAWGPGGRLFDYMNVDNSTGFFQYYPSDVVNNIAEIVWDGASCKFFLPLGSNLLLGYGAEDRPEPWAYFVEKMGTDAPTDQTNYGRSIPTHYLPGNIYAFVLRESSGYYGVNVNTGAGTSSLSSGVVLTCCAVTGD